MVYGRIALAAGRYIAKKFVRGGGHHAAAAAASAYGLYRNTRSSKRPAPGGGGGGSTEEQPRKKRKMGSNKPKKHRRKKAKKFKKKEKQSKVIEAAGYNGYATYSTMKYKKPKLAKTLTWSKQPITYEQLQPWSCTTSATSDQGKNIIASINSDASKGICQSNQLLELYERHAKMRNATAGAWIGLDADHANASHNCVYLSKCAIQYTFTNQAPTSTECELFIVQRKISLRTFVSGLAVNDWTNGLTREQADGSTNVPSFLSNDPTTSKQFNLNWRIVKRVRCKLEPGQEAKHTHIFAPRRLMDTGHLSNYAGGINGIAHESFIVCKGPVSDSTNGFGAGNITTARVKIVGIQKITYTAYAVQNFPRIVFQASDVATSQVALYSIADAAGTVVNTETATNYA